MTTSQASPALERATWRARWPSWVGYAAAIWSLAYGIVGTYWALGGAAYPFGLHWDPSGKPISILDPVPQETFAPILAAVGFAGAVLGVAMARLRRGAPLVGFAATLGVALAVVVPDYRPLMAVARTPIMLVGLPFGFPKGVTVATFVESMYTWPVVNQLLFILGGALWLATGAAFWRRTRSACENCGRTTPPTHWTSPAAAARWGRWAVGVAVAVPVFYAATRWSWALGIPLGVAPRFLRAEAAETPQIWLAGAMLATLAVGGAVLTLGLVQRWGEIYPRWIPFLRGKRVRPRTAIIPATLVACLIPGAGLMEVRRNLPAVVAGGLGDTWGVVVPGMLWPIWVRRSRRQRWRTTTAAGPRAPHVESCRACGRS